MSDIFQLQARPRDEYGKRAARRLRRLHNSVPAVLYGAGQKTQAMTLNHDHAVVALEQEAFFSHILTIQIGDKQEQAVLKSVQRHPYKNKVLHLDFMRITADEKLTMSVPLHFSGEDNAPGVKQGGVATHHINELEVCCLPKDLPEFIDVDAGAMILGQVLHVADLQLPAGVELSPSSGADIAVVSVHMPKVATAEEDADQASEAASADAGKEKDGAKS